MIDIGRLKLKMSNYRSTFNLSIVHSEINTKK